MLLVGSEDGLYRMSGVRESTETTVARVLDPGAVMRIRQFPHHDGVFAATRSGLYHSHDGETWTDLGVPREQVYSVESGPGGRLYAGTCPAHLYATESGADSDPDDDLAWTELEGFQDLPSREEWRLPRHENLAQVRDVHVLSDVPDRIVAGVEVGGVHVSEDGGETWTERRGDVHDDVHELLAVGPEEYVAATGFGLFRTTDAGRSWTRLDEGYDQRYFRSVASVGGDVYAGSALAHTSTWVEPDADPELFVCRDGETLTPVDHAIPEETVTGMTDVDGSLFAGTYSGRVMATDPGSGEWSVVGTLPDPADRLSGYTPLAWFDD